MSLNTKIWFNIITLAFDFILNIGLFFLAKKIEFKYVQRCAKIVLKWLFSCEKSLVVDEEKNQGEVFLIKACSNLEICIDKVWWLRWLLYFYFNTFVLLMSQLFFYTVFVKEEFSQSCLKEYICEKTFINSNLTCETVQNETVVSLNFLCTRYGFVTNDSLIQNVVIACGLISLIIKLNEILLKISYKIFRRICKHNKDNSCGQFKIFGRLLWAISIIAIAIFFIFWGILSFNVTNFINRKITRMDILKLFLILIPSFFSILFGLVFNYVGKESFLLPMFSNFLNHRF